MDHSDNRIGLIGGLSTGRGLAPSAKSLRLSKFSKPGDFPHSRRKKKSTRSAHCNGFNASIAPMVTGSQSA